MIRVLHVDDDPDFADMAAAFVERHDDRFEIETVPSAEAGLDRLESAEFECVVSDYVMPDRNGIEFLVAVRGEFPDLPFILYTGKGSEEIASDAISAGVTDYLQKDDGDGQYELLANRIGNAVEQFRARRRLDERRGQLERLHAASRELMEKKTRREIAAHTSQTALEILDLPLNGVHYYDPDRNGLVPAAYTDAVSEVIGEPPVIGPGDGIAWSVYETGDAQIHADVRDADDVMNPDTPLRSELHLPLGGHGVLVAGSTTPGDFTEADLELANILAANAEAALDRIEQERALRDVSIHREAAMEAGEIGTWEWEIPTDRLTCNAAFARLFGVDPDDASKGVPVDRFVSSIHEGDRDRVEEAIDAAVDRCGDYEEEYRVVNAEGETRWVIARGHVECHEDGTPIRFPGAVTDVTDRRKRERALENERNRLSAMFEAIPDPVTHVRRNQDLQPIVKTVNTAFTETFGFEQAEIEGRSIFDVTVPAEFRDEAKEISREMSSRGEIEREIERLTAEGRRTFLFRSKVFELPDGTTESISVYTDITDRKERERTLEAQNERLNEFTGIVSHDLRSPLTVAKGRADMLADEGQGDNLEPLLRSLDRMDELIDDLLRLARDGDDVTEFKPVDLRSIGATAWRTTATGGAEIDIDTDLTVRADESRLRQLLENLFSNAVEHAGDSVCVTLGELGGGFFVEDDGPGIPREERGRVFEAGYSTHGSNTGFGLSIVEQIAEAHDWTVHVTEARSGGARFEIEGVGIAGE